MPIRRYGRALEAPELPHECFAKLAKFAKAKYSARPDEQIDTRELQHRKIHPRRDQEYRRWLRSKLCSVYGKVDARTEQVHICWSPDRVGNQFASDPCHGGKAYSGRVKRHDSGCFPLCRHAHRQQEDAMDAFDQRFGIDRHEIARRLYAEFIEEMERKGLR